MQRRGSDVGTLTPVEKETAARHPFSSIVCALLNDTYLLFIYLVTHDTAFWYLRCVGKGTHCIHESYLLRGRTQVFSEENNHYDEIFCRHTGEWIFSAR